MVSDQTLQNFLFKDLSIAKRSLSARWVPQLLREEQKLEKMRTCITLLAMTQWQSLAMMDNIVT